MSHVFSLACIDCKEVLDLGKFVNRDVEDNKIDWQFAGWRDLDTGAWYKDLELWSIVQKWMIQHAGHEIRLVPETFLTDQLSECLNFIEERAEVEGRPVFNPDESDLAERLVNNGVAQKLQFE